MEKFNLQSLEAMKSGATRQRAREEMTPDQKRLARDKEREAEQAIKEERQKARSEQYRRQLEEAAQVIELDPKRRESRKRLGLED